MTKPSRGCFISFAISFKLSILRHGHSPSLSEARVASDDERPLSRQGRADVRLAVRELMERVGAPRLILHSPLVRAAQSAQEAAELSGLAAPNLESFPALANILSAPDLYPKLTARAGPADHVLIVGHQPQLGELASWLSKKSLALPPAGLVTLQTQGSGTAQVLWVHSPS